MKIGIIYCALVACTSSYPTIKEDDHAVSERLFNRNYNNFYNSKSLDEKVYNREFEDVYDIDEYQNFSDNFQGSEYINKNDSYYDIENYSQPNEYELGYFSDQTNVNEDGKHNIKGSNQKVGEFDLESSAKPSQTLNINDEKALKLEDAANSENTNSASTTNSFSFKSSTDSLPSTLITSKSIIETLKEISDLDKANYYENKKSKELSAIHEEVDKLIKEMDDDKGDGFDIVGDIKQKADQLLVRVKEFKKLYYD